MNSLQKVWIVGANGRVGHELLKLFMEKEIEVFYTDEDEIDIVKMEDVINYADMNRPHDIINCAGMTDVTACENNMDAAYKVNAIGARNLSIAARKVGARMIQLSTDDVFDGQTDQPYTEFDTPNPRTVYGKSKLAGENYVRELTTKHIIIRSSWIFGSGENYVKNLLEEANQNYNISVAKDQFASPTSAKLLAHMILYLMDFGEYGLFHVTCQGVCSRYEFANEVLRLSETKARLHPVTTEKDKLTNYRPTYSVLDNLMLRLLGIPLLPPWQEALKEYIQAIKK
ncbi:dTDP-4-dehydrorhamnose reductase [Clostridium sp. Marseille-P299]|uniref:dTDP-4-dehydrorhamnose reductase n=1 Tax=Clostridium sp. Marseille-P299 TaxID=1805477 RepID=UPI00082D9E0E|nr:dTDP-4-dehydrorhamnose reductase [Clostridium sp. Marseille-P299]